jgi:hypothetical protein
MILLLTRIGPDPSIGGHGGKVNEGHGVSLVALVHRAGGITRLYSAVREPRAVDILGTVLANHTTKL